MARPYATPEQWGQRRNIPPGSWSLDQIQDILTRDAPPEEMRHLPRVNTLICGVERNLVSPPTAQDYSLRWSLRMGVGGARVEVRFDAVGFTRIACPLEAFSLGLVVERYPPPFPLVDLPDTVIDAFALVAEGGIGHSVAEGATHTTLFRLVTTIAADVVIVPVPVGASAVRVLGISATGGGLFTPFAATKNLNFLQSGSLLNTLVGEGAAVADPSLRTLYYSGQWFPLPGSMTELSFSNAAFPETVNVVVQFKIDI